MKKTILFSLIILSVLSCRKYVEEYDDPIIPLPADSLFTLYTAECLLWYDQNSSILTHDSNLILAGSKDNNLLFLKITKSGEEIWRNEFFDGNMSFINSIVQSKSGDLFACGSANESKKALSDVIVIKLNSNGDSIWTKKYGSTAYDYGNDIITTPDNNLLIIGHSKNTIMAEDGHIFVMKINEAGDSLWSKNISKTGDLFPESIIITKNGKYLITANNSDSDNADVKGLYYFMVNLYGDLNWRKQVFSGVAKLGYSTIELFNGDIVTCGQYADQYGSEVIVTKTDSQGELLWENTYGNENKTARGNCIKQNLDGSFTIIGTVHNIDPSAWDIILFNIDQNGNERWFKKLGTSESDWGISLIKDNNDNNIISGNSDGKLFMTKMDNEGNYNH
ncbi:MAG TPA: hypothetical protein PK904_14560 [Bacteroidales bacterium]|nr:hypothetical protein [Bacteroidales bacterium]